ncbi:MAG: iron-containing alcohol dehydrogenase [Candidatus Aminicenantes bacterium]|nr:iron-containing alcohol dehydrogenase [Candidatus Aminicenantes bacterium]
MNLKVPTKIIFGSGILSRLKEIIEEEFRASRVFLVTDKGIMDSGIGNLVLSQLEDTQVFDEIEANPKSPTVDRAGEQVRKDKPDLVVGLGGGSPMDAAKAIALLATNKGHIKDYEGKRKYKFPPLPVLAIPTTCGTGSEVTWVSVITHPERRFKMSIKGPEMFPAVALVDPDMLLSLPPPLIASTGMDALTHAIEAYTVKGATEFSNNFARQAIELIFDSLPDAFENIKDNKKARERIMSGSTLAGIAFCNSDVGAVHCLAEACGGLYDLPHGELNSIFLPQVLEFNLPVAKTRYAEIARLAGIQEKDESLASQELVHKIKSMTRVMNIPSFQDLGLEESEFPDIASAAFQNNSNPSNPREVRYEDYLEILKNALHSS